MDNMIIKIPLDLQKHAESEYIILFFLIGCHFFVIFQLLTLVIHNGC